ncbi:hypothetical protein QQS21_010329 [Conoideocrella luteorostrata]|uniref:Arylamine N-acetyltransferase n=1 Tax=Conoideocrella luteorostrata TaxID=1105319 RepID=A0AAJ0CHL1_9HYPO|nr:hypothetical protein QQS21_010329 [Conoideocrella luteorostrata]
MSRFNPAYRQTYTPSQIQQYFERVQLPKVYRDVVVATIADTQEGLAFLHVLLKHQLAYVPFENLELHYSSHHTIALDPQHLFYKVVARNTGRGGYCMENSTLFGTVLKSLGFDVVTVGAKVNEAVQPIAASPGWKGPVYDGWNHMLNIVTIAGTRYLVDVGFGSNGPTCPLPLAENRIVVNVGQQEMRLQYKGIPDLTQTSQKLWVYQFRNGADQPWLPSYAFSEMEFTPNDFAMMNHFTSTHRTSWFTYLVVCVKMVLEEGEIVGDITLFGNEVKKRVGDNSELLALCGSEEQRIAALEEFLHVKLDAAERNGIHGMITEIG